jgi:AcrR family transcriptional regulator
MSEKHDREKLIVVALDLCMRQGYEATTIDQIAAAGGATSHAVGQYFATKDAIILSIVDDIVVAVATELARIPPQTSPPEALLAANTAVISDIANGAGVITRERMQALAHILTASLDLREKASALGKEVLSVALAERMGVGPEDSRVPPSAPSVDIANLKPPVSPTYWAGAPEIVQGPPADGRRHS